MRMASLTLCEETSFNWLPAVYFFLGTSRCNIQQKSTIIDRLHLP
jgi:hypothetical protein